MEDIFTCKAIGNSMNPTICSGNTLIIKKGIDNLDINNIILYVDNNKKYYAHRIVDFFYCGNIPIIVTKGDNCVYDDKPIEIYNVIGVVTKIIK